MTESSHQNCGKPAKKLVGGRKTATLQRAGRYWLYAIMASCFQNSVANHTNEHQYQKKSGEGDEFTDNGMHYIAYTDGSCDNNSFRKAGGSAYVLIKDGEVVRVKNHGQLNTTNNRMELLAIISAVNACQDGACVDVYTDSKYSILTLEKTYKPDINGDLWELYKKNSRHVAGVRLHWVKGHNGDHYNEMVDEMAYGAYCEICDKYGIKKSNRH